jgi:hypothetical protein
MVRHRGQGEMDYLNPMPFEPSCHTTHYRFHHVKYVGLLNYEKCPMAFHQNDHEPKTNLSEIEDSDPFELGRDHC